LHLAVMERHGIVTIASFDTVFDGVPDIERLA
jgi:predicted nucleic acid-binding protein